MVYLISICTVPLYTLSLNVQVDFPRRGAHAQAGAPQIPSQPLAPYHAAHAPLHSPVASA